MATAAAPAPAPAPAFGLAPRNREIAINKPITFDGDRQKIRSFLQQCTGYLQLNRHIYDTDEAKIAFILSFLNEGEAYKWREAYLNGILDPTTGFFVYPAYPAFIALIQTHF